MTSTRFQNIGIIGKFGDPNIIKSVQRLSNFLLRENLQVFLDEGIQGITSEDTDLQPRVKDRAEIGRRCDLVIVVGGDGTLLNAARTLVTYEIPMLGINLGRLGFLADVSPQDMEESLRRILAGDYREEKRLLLRTHIERDGQALEASSALNDVVIHKWDVARMIEVDTYIDGQFVNTQRSDGLIIATPTGSTAYALSGGGPILHPALDIMVLVPICPHTLSNRPLVVNADSRIENILSTSQGQAQISCDGQINYQLLPGDRVVTTRQTQKIRLLHPSEHSYFEILRAKLKWGQQ